MEEELRAEFVRVSTKNDPEATQRFRKKTYSECAKTLLNSHFGAKSLQFYPKVVYGTGISIKASPDQNLSEDFSGPQKKPKV